mmetsp:Transcript_967/g.4094  ORF Transcript_967/g.4094 Transcript_967/m.4094 type:complete len:264 (-) Transcript_967:4653-5444(-)
MLAQVSQVVCCPSCGSAGRHLQACPTRRPRRTALQGDRGTLHRLFGGSCPHQLRRLPPRPIGVAAISTGEPRPEARRASSDSSATLGVSLKGAGGFAMPTRDCASAAKSRVSHGARSWNSPIIAKLAVARSLLMPWRPRCFQAFLHQTSSRFCFVLLLDPITSTIEFTNEGRQGAEELRRRKPRLLVHVPQHAIELVHRGRQEVVRLLQAAGGAVAEVLQRILLCVRQGLAIRNLGGLRQPPLQLLELASQLVDQHSTRRDAG